MASEPETRTASTIVERMQLVSEWLEYLSGAQGGAKGFVVFQSPTGRYVQFAFDPNAERVRVEVGTSEWQKELGGAIPARAEERLAGRDFNAPDREHGNFWQDIDQFRSRSLSSVTEWAFRDVFAEPADFRLSVSQFETYGKRPEVRIDSQPAASVRPHPSGLTRKSVWLIELLVVVTYWIYIPYWFLSRRKTFNALSSEQKLWKNVLVVWLAWFIVDAFLYAVFFVQPDLAAWETIDPIIESLNGMSWIVEVLSAFSVRKILRSHFATVEDIDIGVSWVATALFGFLYLQYKINQLTPKNLAQDRSSLR